MESVSQRDTEVAVTTVLWILYPVTLIPAIGLMEKVPFGFCAFTLAMQQTNAANNKCFFIVFELLLCIFYDVAKIV